MGYIDKVTASLTCPKCAATEFQAVLQKGSSYGASWGQFRQFIKFDAKFSSTNGEPEVVSATCKACGIGASLDHTSST